MTCPRCNFDSRPDAKFCGNCGSPLESDVVCPRCSWVNPAIHRFCDNCGAAIGETDREDAIPSPSAPVRSTTRAPSGLRPYWKAGETRFLMARDRMAPYAAPLLLVGAGLALLAQAVFIGADSGDAVPRLGIAALALGVALFALGAFARTKDIELDQQSWFDSCPIRLKLSLTAVPYFGIGVLSMAFIALRIGEGTTSAWDLFLWALAIAAFIIPTLPPIRLRRPQISRSWLTDALLIAAFVGLFIALIAYDMQDWYYSAIGDEYAFYLSAKDVAENGVSRLFSQEGVYGKHPVISTVYQALVMVVFGQNHFGWTFSSALSVAISIPGIYLLGRMFGGRTAAIVATSAFAFSHHIFAFAHIGYNNLDALPPTIWSIYLFLLGARRRSLPILMTAGAIVGLGLYFHFSARLVIPILFLFALSNIGRERAISNLWPAALGFSLTAIPALVANQEALFTVMLGEVIGGHPEATIGDAVARVRENLTRNLFAFSYNPRVSHYVSGPLLDPVTAVLAMLGIGLALGQLRRCRSRIILSWLFITIVSAGVLSPYSYVSITRLYIVIAPLALLAGVIASYAQTALRALPISDNLKKSVAYVAPAVLTLAIIGLNVWQFWVVTPGVFHHSQEAVAIGALRDVCDRDIEGTVIVGRNTGSLIKLALSSYRPDGPLPRFVDHDEIESDALTLEAGDRCAIFVNPDDEAARATLEALVQAHPSGRAATFSNESGHTSVSVFQRPPG